ncbi:hypothetical protein HDU83_000064 [Entophlyctis luteolus]|nr:hypothetical protein HDU83_000064 [Entophlyctis luteolus]
MQVFPSAFDYTSPTIAAFLGTFQVLPAMSPSHVDPLFVDKFGAAIQLLRTTLTWDATAANLLEICDDVLCINTDIFGDWFAECIWVYGGKVDSLRPSLFGDRPSLAQVESALKAKKYKLITITHVDTSSGVLNNVGEICRVVRCLSPETLIALDGVCSVGAEVIKQEEWGIDVVMTGSQTALGVPPGLAVMVVSKRAAEVALAKKSAPTTYFASFKKWLPIMQKYEARQPSYFATPPVQLILALQVSLSQLVVGQGAMHQRFAENRAASAKVKMRSNPNTLTAVYYPAGVKPVDFLGKLAAKGVVLAGGLHPEYATKYFRIGHMNVSVVNEQMLGHLDVTLNAIKTALLSFADLPFLRLPSIAMTGQKESANPSVFNSGQEQQGMDNPNLRWRAVRPIRGRKLQSLPQGRPLRLCFVSDFFFPNVGGVESHMHFLAQELVLRGHSVVIVSHAYGNRVGVRHLASGAKAYYIPLRRIVDQVALPTLYSMLPLLRVILLRERIDLVHAHQAFSAMAHEAIINAKTMGIPAVFTDHSLFGFDDVAGILTNKLLKFSLCDADHVICVSHTGKENTVLRACLDPHDVSVIPNAVVADNFCPAPEARDPSKITIVVISRLAYRKGTDLLVSVIPPICLRYPQVEFIIGGDGVKRIQLEQMREKHMLQDRVKVLGFVKHENVRNVLVQGHIFLNTSLTEAFCTAIVEAACCGLLVVSTSVGGIPEVLPDHMIVFSKPDHNDLVSKIEKAISIVQLEPPDPFTLHKEIRSMYSWSNVAERTELVYNRVMVSLKEPISLADRLRKFQQRVGVWAGKFSVMIIAVSHLLFLFLEWLVPRESIDSAVDFDIFFADAEAARRR